MSTSVDFSAPATDPDLADILVVFGRVLRTFVEGEVRRCLHEDRTRRPRALTLSEVAEATGLSRSSVQRIVTSGGLRVVRVNRRVLVAVSEVERLLSEGYER